MMHVLTSIFGLLGLGLASNAGPRLPVPEFEISLDASPDDRFTEVLTHFKEPLQDFMEYLRAEKSAVKLLTLELARRRGPENDELQREIENIARITGATVNEIHAMQMLYELSGIMVPIVNLTDVAPEEMSLEEIAGLLSSSPDQARSPADFPLLHVGCTGIIGTDERDGTVYHARNLDFSFATYLQAMTYTGVFTRNGAEVFRAQTIAGYSSILTGMRKGPNGYSIEINTRFTDHAGGYWEMLENLFTYKRDISGWTKRKILENLDNYEDAVEAFSNTPYPTSEYNIVAGVKKGVILARNADGLAYQLPLNESSKKYIIMTNFDYIWKDVKEYFDPTTIKGIGHPRRIEAEKILDGADDLTPELLFSVLNDDGVMAKDTIFQVIMNVETGLWNASLPACVECRNETLLI